MQYVLCFCHALLFPTAISNARATYFVKRTIRSFHTATASSSLGLSTATRISAPTRIRVMETSALTDKATANGGSATLGWSALKVGLFYIYIYLFLICTFERTLAFCICILYLCISILTFSLSHRLCPLQGLARWPALALASTCA